MGNVKAIITGAKDIGVEGWHSLKNIGDFLFYVMHPGIVIQAMWKFTLLYSYWIFSIIALVALILYIMGFKKCLKYVPLSAAIYALVRMIGSACL